MITVTRKKQWMINRRVDYQERNFEEKRGERNRLQKKMFKWWHPEAGQNRLNENGAIQ